MISLSLEYKCCQEHLQQDVPVAQLLHSEHQFLVCTEQLYRHDDLGDQGGNSLAIEFVDSRRSTSLELDRVWGIFQC